MVHILGTQLPFEVICINLSIMYFSIWYSLSKEEEPNVLGTFIFIEKECHCCIFIEKFLSKKFQKSARSKTERPSRKWSINRSFLSICVSIEDIYTSFLELNYLEVFKLFISKLKNVDKYGRRLLFYT